MLTLLFVKLYIIYLTNEFYKLNGVGKLEQIIGWGFHMGGDSRVNILFPPWL